jgi:hypothetical protein
VSHSAVFSNSTDVDFVLTDIMLESEIGPNLSEEFKEFRRRIYHDETKLLPIDQTFDHNDLVGTHLIVREKKSGPIIASVCVLPAERSNFSEHSGIAPEKLIGSFFATRASVRADCRQKGLFSLLMYLAGRHIRIEGRKNFISYLEIADDLPAGKILPINELPNANQRIVQGANGNTYALHAVFCDVNQTMSCTFNRLSDELKEWVARNLMTEEINLAVDRGLEAFYRGPFCQSVFNRSISKSQYIEVMANNYQFVRWTTRLVAKAVSDCSDRDTRLHILEHLKGEIDHEVWIENDLRHLGADVDYVINDMVPNPYIHQFMTVQESTIHFTRDTTKFLGIPIAIEAITAFMPPEFIVCLKEAIESWGVKSPGKACTFLASHIHTDGGERGHWQATLEMLGSMIRSEKELQWILNLVEMVFSSVTRGYNECVSMPAIDFVASKVGLTLGSESSSTQILNQF